MSKDGDTPLWVLLHCKNDDSHVLVKESAVIYEDEVVLEEEVMFAYPGFKSLLEGTVKGYSRDYESLKKHQDSLNSSTKPKRHRSVLDTGKRRAASACIEGFKRLAPRPRSGLKSSGKSKKSAPAKPMLKSTESGSPESDSHRSTPESGSPEFSPGKLSSHKMDLVKNDDFQSDASYTSDSNDSLDKNDSSSSESEDGCEAELAALLAKMKAKKKKVDLEVLAQLGQSTSFANSLSLKGDLKHNKMIPRSSSKVDDKENISPTSPVKPTHSISMNRETGEVDIKKLPLPSQQSAVEVKVSPTISDLCKKGTRKRKRMSKAVTDIVFEGESLKFSSESPGVTKLTNEYDVFISSSDLKKAKGTCKSSSHYCRALTRAVFTPESRISCSVMGKLSLVKGQALPERRTKLNQDGVDAIVASVIARAHKKDWGVPTPANVKQYMGNLLCEERGEAKVVAEEKEESSR